VPQNGGRAEKKWAAAKTVKKELAGSLGEIGNIEGLLLLKPKGAEKKQALLNDFDFAPLDKVLAEKVAGDADERIASLNSKLCLLNRGKKKILSPLAEGQIFFSASEAELLFNEAGVMFAGQIKKAFDQLISFNRAISVERGACLREALRGAEKEAEKISAELDTLGKKRSEMLSFLSDTDVLNKYKK
jgi:uncharacterized protein YydD (DUF2326 family)